MERWISYFLDPSHGLWLLIIIGWLVWRLTCREGGKRLAKLGIAGLAIAHLTPLGYILIQPLEDRFPQPQPPADIAGIIMLAGGEQERLSELRGQSLYNAAGDRLIQTRALAARYPTAQIILTGGGRENAQARISAEVLAQMGVDAARIRYETNARNTYENAVNGLALRDRKDGRWLLVTSAFHMPRAIGVFRKAGWSITAWPTDYRTHASAAWSIGPGAMGIPAAATLDRAVHEWIGLAAYRMRGWTSELYPGPQGSDH